MQRFNNTVDSIIDGIIPDNDKKMQELREEYLNGNASDVLCNYQRYDTKKAYASFIRKVKPARNIRRRLIALSVGVAASVAALVVFLPFLQENDEPKVVAMIVKESCGINPAAGEKKSSPIPAHSAKLPTLRLASGEVVELSGQDIHLPSIDILASGSSISISTASAKVQQLQLTIPRGRQYDLTLSDGTHVWLNSETTLTFPTKFENERKVAVKGQAFFEVAHTGEPFRVECSRGTVNVMGTTFDIRDYSNETTLVTLVSGSVEYTSQTTNQILTPGEQIRHEASNGTPQLYNVNTHQYTAWKEGLIYFYEQRLEDVMKEIERMYDVKVTIDDPYLCDRLFTGECSRYESVEEFLRLLSLTDEFSYVTEKINNKKYITITIKQ